MKKSLIIVFLGLIGCFQLNAQTAPDWTLTDIDGNIHSLSDDLAAGKVVILDFFATWCGNCWNYDQTNALADLYAQKGPDGDDTFRVYKIEGSSSTNTNDIYGTGSNTLGNWTGDIPIMESVSTTGAYGVSGFPTIRMICPTADGNIMYNIGQLPTAAIIAQANANCTAQVTFLGRTLFEGFHNGSGQMTTDLVDNGIIPNAQPYSDAPWNYSGGELVTNFPTNTVDWVYLELRDATDDTEVLAKAVGFLDKFGYLRGIDGLPGISFNGYFTGDYNVALFHRGHTAIMTANPITLPNINTYDFTTSASMAKGAGQLKDDGGSFVMLAGDFNGSGVNNIQDFVRWAQNNTAVNEYLSHDVDGTGIVNILDFLLWFNNSSHVGYPGIWY